MKGAPVIFTTLMMMNVTALKVTALSVTAQQLGYCPKYFFMDS